MEAKYRARRPDADGSGFVIVAGMALILLAVVISAAVIYFIGSTLPYAGSPEVGPPPVETTSLVNVSSHDGVAAEQP